MLVPGHCLFTADAARTVEAADRVALAGAPEAAMALARGRQDVPSPRRALNREFRMLYNFIMVCISV